MIKQMRVGVVYTNNEGRQMYVTKFRNEVMYSTPSPKNPRPFSLNKAKEIQGVLIADGVDARCVYE